ncbi:MAG: glycogen/starch/alpha-glucan phosphorylase [Clostridia bacterium]|nr:glycogen/starch/alpha-glucan phosphorylase [Clostridia bacterium]
MNFSIDKAKATELITSRLSHFFGVAAENASYEQHYRALAMIVRDLMAQRYSEVTQQARKKKTKCIYYLCMEFLMGRSLKNNLYNLGLTDVFKEALSTFGVQLDDLYECEPDAGLGNGGLGRLAACYLDALASSGYSVMGYSIRYEYGIFKQKLVDGWQTELPDFWLPGGRAWLVPHEEASIEVRFEGEVGSRWDNNYHITEHKNYKSIKAVPYDMCVSGKDGRAIAILRLWRAKAPGIDMQMFNDGAYMNAMESNAMAEVISKILYPSDNHEEGKSLRLKQQYFLVSATVQDIVRRHLSGGNSLDTLPDLAAIHINDTHPTLAIPELMRILLDECGYEWDRAWSIVKRTFAYTNHTVMKEALECWPEGLFKRLLPRIYEIVKEIDNRFRYEVWEKTGDAQKVESMAVVSNGAVNMANLCVLTCHSVNGVSPLHSDIVKNTVFADFNAIMPYKFKNVTNGIAYRRWLCQANPALTEFLKELIGDGFVNDAGELLQLEKFKDDESVLKALHDIKQGNKKRLASLIYKRTGERIDECEIFDVQVKRLHEYKRQQLNALHILYKYLEIKDSPNAPHIPHTYIFAAKAAPGYFTAKKIISLICSVSRLVNSDPQVNKFMKVVYLEDYNVTLSETVMPACNISEQISLAGTEASGTGNMKFMLGGGLTLGTLDGANIEIFNQVGAENMFIFGMNAQEANRLRASGYNPHDYYMGNPQLRRTLDFIRDGFDNKDFSDIFNLLTTSDYYMTLADFEDYRKAQIRASENYTDTLCWNKKSLINIARAGVFSADRAVKEYAENIWRAKPIED